MKKFFKFGCLSIIALVVLGIVIGIASGGGGSSTTKPSGSVTKEKAAPTDTITKPNYDSIVQGDTLSGEGGMTIDEVVNILGNPSTKTESQSGDMKMDSYTWHKGFTGPSIAITFMNGKVSNKLWME